MSHSTLLRLEDRDTAGRALPAGTPLPVGDAALSNLIEESAENENEGI